jgi:ABC-type multidrug transport system ATPase subunit
MSEAESANNGVYFLSLELENVRCFGKKQKLDLSDGNGNPARWTVILGDNGTGKTTLLEVLEKYSLLDFNGDVYSLPRNNCNKPELEYCFAFGNILKTIESSTPKKRTIDLEYSGTYFPIYAEEFFRGKKFNLYTYKATRKLGRNKQIEENNDELIDAEEWLLERHHAAKINPKFQKHFELVKDTLLRVLPNNTITDIEVCFPNPYIPKPRIGFLANGIQLPLSDLSLGYQSMITWIVDLVAHLFEQYPESTDPIAEPAVVLIDEIDLHLHPKWQREIMRYLSERFINTQFIVTAHSPLIVQAAEDENANIVVLQRKGDEVEIKQDFKAFHGWRVDQLLASDLFDNQPTRSDDYEEWMRERREILGKAHLTDADKIRLEELKVQMGNIPTAESPEDIEAMEFIRSTAKLLRAKK